MEIERSLEAINKLLRFLNTEIRYWIMIDGGKDRISFYGKSPKKDPRSVPVVSLKKKGDDEAFKFNSFRCDG